MHSVVRISFNSVIFLRYLDTTALLMPTPVTDLTRAGLRGYNLGYAIHETGNQWKICFSKCSNSAYYLWFCSKFSFLWKISWCSAMWTISINVTIAWITSLWMLYYCSWHFILSWRSNLWAVYHEQWIRYILLTNSMCRKPTAFRYFDTLKWNEKQIHPSLSALETSINSVSHVK